MQRKVASAAEYLQAIPPAQLPLVEHLRALIRQAAPQAREEIRWGMLAYDDAGGLFALAAQKRYVSLYVMVPEALEKMEAELADVDRGKGCLRFTRLEGVPTKSIERLLKLAAKSHERECKKA